MTSLHDCVINTPVFFMTDVRELRIELIFPRSTLARSTPRGVVGTLVTLACTGVTGAVVTAAAADVTGLETVVGVVGDFDVVSNFKVLETEGEDLSFFSSIRKKIINKNH